MPLSLASRAPSSHPRPSLPWSSAATSACLRRALRSISSNSCFDTSCRENGPRARGHQQWDLASSDPSTEDGRSFGPAPTIPGTPFGVDRRPIANPQRTDGGQPRPPSNAAPSARSLHTITSCHPLAPPARAARFRRPPAPPARAAHSRRPLAPPACVQHAVILALRRFDDDTRGVSTTSQRRSRAARSRRPLGPPVYATRAPRPLASPSRAARSRRPLVQSPRPARSRRFSLRVSTVHHPTRKG